MSVCAVVLTLNEEESIGRCLASLSGFDEVHVLDSGSTDATVAIAESMGATVSTHVPQGTFLISNQRNWALAHCGIKSEWVLFLDADEVATPAFHDAVRECLLHGQDSDGFYAAPAFTYNGKWIRRTSGYPNWHPRVVRANLLDPFIGGVWEEFRPDGKWRRIEVPYIHFPSDKGLKAWLEKHLRYASWDADAIESIGSKEASITARKRLLRQIRYRLGGARKYFAIIHLAILRGGLFEGPQGRSYLRRMFIYELLIDEVLTERRYSREENVPHGG